MPREHAQARITGAVFPLSSAQISNLFSCNRDVFAKFTKLNLERGSKIVFYISRQKMLAGEARVEKIEKLTPDVAWSRYKNRLILNKEEFDTYVRISPITKRERKMREITVFILANVKKYRKPIRSILPVTSSGRYLTNEIWDMLKNRRLDVCAISTYSMKERS